MRGKTSKELKDRDETIARLKEDAERLAVNYVEFNRYAEVVCRYCRVPFQFSHAPDCPITLHNELMKELESRDYDNQDFYKGG